MQIHRCIIPVDLCGVCTFPVELVAELDISCRKGYWNRKQTGVSLPLPLSISAGLTSFLRNGSRQEVVDRLPIVCTRNVPPPFNKLPAENITDVWKFIVSVSEYRGKLSMVFKNKHVAHRFNHSQTIVKSRSSIYTLK